MYNLYLLIYLFIAKGVIQFMRTRAKETNSLFFREYYFHINAEQVQKQKNRYLMKELKMHFRLRRNK